MQVIEERVGDLFQAADVDAIAHGCNCAGAMGRGIAVEFRTRWPTMYSEYKKLCVEGRFTPGDVMPWKIEEPESWEWVYNLGTQKHWRAKATPIAIENSVRAMIEHASDHGVLRIAMPRVGAGLGGLPWEAAREALHSAIAESSCTLVIYSLPPAQG